ncbi:hypothetical protein HANVADRAFT_53074, partial [Hanseniaspora valbyensis NRRL Y-1626]
MSFDNNTDLLLDIIWPVAKEDKHIRENKENKDKEISDSIYEKLTSNTTFLINRDISNISFNENNVLIVNELRRVLLDNNSNNQLEDKLNKIIMNMNTSKLLGGGGASSNNGTSNETKQGIKKKKKTVNKNNSKNGIKKFTKMNVLEEFKPTILSHEDINTGNSNINNNNNEWQKSSNIKTIDTFQLIDLSMDSRKLAKRE